MENSKEIYLDNAASTPISKEVIEEYTNLLTNNYANPSSLHKLGINSEKIIKNTRDVISSKLNISPNEIIFTSGGTESNNLAIFGIAERFRNQGGHFITNVIEHPSVLEPYKILEERGFSVTYLKVDNNGLISLNDLENAITSDTRMVSIMQVNNEIGNINPISEIGSLVKKVNKRTLFHVDGVQGFGKISIDLYKSNVDFYSVSGHKIHAPKGVGFLFKKNNVTLPAILHGGSQQNNLRSGTENPPLVHALGIASKIAFNNLDKNYNHVANLKNHFLDKLNQTDLNFEIMGENQSPYIVSLFINGVRGEVILNDLSSKNIFVSTGSACNTNRQKKNVISHLDKNKIDGIIRISFSHLNTSDECDELVNSLVNSINQFSHYNKK